MVKSLQKEVTQDFQDFTYNTYNGKLTEKQVEVSFKFIYIAKVGKHAGQRNFVGL